MIKQGTISERMRQIRKTEVVKAAVQFQDEVRGGGTVKIRPGGSKGPGPPLKKVSVQDMIADIRSRYAISEEDALYIKQVTEAKEDDLEIRATVHTHRDDQRYLEEAYRLQVNGKIQDTYSDLGRYDELTDTKYSDTGGIFDIMAVTVIQYHLDSAA